MQASAQCLNKALNHIETLGNRLPHPCLIFIYLCVLIILASAIAAQFDLNANHPVTGQDIQAKSLLSIDGLHYILQHTVTNFTQFAPLGTVLIAILGIGIAERSGLLAAALSALLKSVPPSALTFIVALAGVLSSLGADAGYVVLIPLSAILFQNAGRPALAGIATAFAGVSAGFSANLAIGPIDIILAGISNEAIKLADSEYEVSVLGNYYFTVVSTILIAAIVSLITRFLVEPRLSGQNEQQAQQKPADKTHKKALLIVAVFSLVFFSLLALATIPADGWLRNTQTGSLIHSPFISGLVVLIALYFALSGIIYGRISGEFHNSKDVINSMETSISTMAAYLVLMFFAAQFVNYFNWSQLGAILAIQGASCLQQSQLSAASLLISFILVSALINLFVGSASAKWALMAPIFVPMLYLAGISPEATQMAFRIGDSSTNIITPLMPYFALVLGFARQYQANAGLGTLSAMMLPYMVCLLISWSLLLLIWVTLDWPLGPGVSSLVQG